MLQKNKKRTSPAKIVALVGMCAAITECGKLVLASVPNVKVVTILTALFSYVFGIYGLLSTVLFVFMEMMIWGVNTWVISYFIYWPALAALFWLLGKVRLKNRILLTLAALVMTFLFGVISSLVEIGLFQGYFDKFFTRFFIYYSRGAGFYAAQIVTNLLLFPLLFRFLAGKLYIVKRKFLG